MLKSADKISGIAGAQNTCQDDEKSLRNFRTMGICGHSYTGAAVAADAPGTICAGCGAMQYSVKKFLLAMTLGRIVRYMILAYLAARYGRKMLPFLL
jgi:membrane protein YqaA with SNARE-associated domain